MLVSFHPGVGLVFTSPALDVSHSVTGIWISGSLSRTAIPGSKMLTDSEEDAASLDIRPPTLLALCVMHI